MIVLWFGSFEGFEGEGSEGEGWRGMERGEVGGIVGEL